MLPSGHVGLTILPVRAKPKGDAPRRLWALLPAKPRPRRRGVKGDARQSAPTAKRFVRDSVRPLYAAQAGRHRAAPGRVLLPSPLRPRLRGEGKRAPGRPVAGPGGSPREGRRALPRGSAASARPAFHMSMRKGPSKPRRRGHVGRRAGRAAGRRLWKTLGDRTGKQSAPAVLVTAGALAGAASGNSF